MQLLNAVFDRLKDEYGGIRNNFLCDCIKRGCQEIVKEEFDIQDVQDLREKNVGLNLTNEKFFSFNNL